MRTATGSSLIVALCIGHAANAQFNVLGSVHGRTNAAITGVSIGNVPTVPTGQAFQVRGDLLGAGSTGEVFKTDCPNGSATYWRLFRGGTERGRLFNTATGTNANDLQLQSTVLNGQLWLRNSGTDGIRLNSQVWTANPNGTIVNTNGFVGIGNHSSGVIATQGPWSRLHLDDGGAAITSTFRPWMRNGIYMSGFDDMMYVGQLGGRPGFDNCDAVIAWGDNAFAPAGPDNFRFLFMGNATDVEGQEVVRLTGNGMFGIGDFNTANVQPDERLDLLTGTARIRQLPSPTYQAPATDDDKVMVVRTDGRVNWRDAGTLGGNNACTWGLNGNNDVHTAWDGFPCPPQGVNNVGIGMEQPQAKLNVLRREFTGMFEEKAVLAEVYLDDGRSIGVDVVALNPNPAPTNVEITGVRSLAMNGINNCGVFSLAMNDPDHNSTGLIGVYAEAQANSGTNMSIGVWGRATGLGSSDPWAAWFDGRTFCTDGVWAASDAMFKQNVAPVQGALSLIQQLQPKSYTFDTVGFASFGFTSTPHIGFLAQELEVVLPQLVRDVQRPERVDSMGVVTEPAVSFKAVNYEEMIPLLVAAVQEQNTRIDQLQQQLDQCCNAGGGIGTPRSMDAGTASNGLARETDLRIIPNPVAASTQLRYTVATEGRVRLEVSDAMGRLIEVLEEGQRTAGEFTFQWNTSGLAPGTYYCTLLVNEEPLVKRAVKLNER